MIQILLWFIQPRVVQNLLIILSSVECKRRYFVHRREVNVLAWAGMITKWFYGIALTTL